MIPFEPESIESAKKRIDAALVDVFDMAAIARMPESQRPGMDRKHVFDFEDGIRLLVSRDRMPGGEVIVHISASFDKELSGPLPPLTWDVIAKIKKRWLELGRKPLEFVLITPDKHIPHFVER